MYAFKTKNPRYLTITRIIIPIVIIKHKCLLILTYIQLVRRKFLGFISRCILVGYVLFLWRAKNINGKTYPHNGEIQSEFTRLFFSFEVFTRKV